MLAKEIAKQDDGTALFHEKLALEIAKQVDVMEAHRVAVEAVTPKPPVPMTSDVDEKALYVKSHVDAKIHDVTNEKFDVKDHSGTNGQLDERSRKKGQEQTQPTGAVRWMLCEGLAPCRSWCSPRTFPRPRCGEIGSSLRLSISRASVRT